MFATSIILAGSLVCFLAAPDGVADCDGDGLPDELPFYRPLLPTDQQWHGMFESEGYGPRFVIAAWYPTDPNHQIITGMRFGIWSSWIEGGTQVPPPACDPAGTQYTAFIAADPNGDQFPDDAVLLWHSQGVLANSTDQFMATPPTLVSAPGFFVGIVGAPSVFNNYNMTCGAFLGSEPCDHLSQPGKLPCGPALVGIMPANSSPTAAPAVTTLVPNLGNNFLPDIAAYSVACTLLGDLTGDGKVNGADLGVLLGAWGPSQGTPADLNHDSTVDGTDLGLLLAAWTG